jgi:hypothetical protein
MFVRVLQMKLKPGGGKGLSASAEKEILPILKKFTGFAGEFTLVSADGKEALGVTLWERKEDAETYNREGTASVLKVVEKYTEGKSVPHIYNVAHSTVQTLPVRKAA